MAANYRPTVRTAIARHRASLDGVFERAHEIADVETQADAARFIYVRVSGFLEQAINLCALHYVKEKSGGPARSFAESYLSRTFNPNKDALLNFVGRFDATWRDELEVLLSTDERASTLGALVAMRNDIAHGKQTGASLRRAREYRQVADEVADFLLDRFHPLQP